MPTGLLIGAAVIGLGLSVKGTMDASAANKKMAQNQQEQIAEQQALEAQRKKQMELEYKRNQVEILRNQQRSRASALANSTAQGAMFGSGLQGGYGQIQGMAGTQELALDQNAEIGRNIFGINAQMSQSKMQYAGFQSQLAQAQGLSSLGGSIVNAAGSLSRIGGSVGPGISRGLSFGTGPGSWQGGNVNG